MGNTELALEKLLGNAFKNVIEKTDKSAEKVEIQAYKYCESLSDAASNAWGQIDRVKYIVIGCLIAFVALGCYTTFNIQQLTDEVWRESIKTTQILTGDQKYWFDKENQRLYQKYVQDQKNTSETR